MLASRRQNASVGVPDTNLERFMPYLIIEVARRGGAAEGN